MCSNCIHRDRTAGANVCDDSSDATHDLPPAQYYTPTNLSNKFSESTTTITTNTTEEQNVENLAVSTRQELSRTTSEDEEDLSDSRQTGVSSADNSFASAARGLGECETDHNMCSQGPCCCYCYEKLNALALKYFIIQFKRQMSM